MRSELVQLTMVHERDHLSPFPLKIVRIVLQRTKIHTCALTTPLLGLKLVRKFWFSLRKYTRVILKTPRPVIKNWHENFDTAYETTPM